MAKVADIRFKPAGRLYHFRCSEVELQVGDVAIVEVEKGIGIGKVVVAPRQMDAAKLEHKLKKIVRKADPIDLERDQFNREREREAFNICKEKINKYKLQMKLVEVEYLFDSSKAIFYFTSESRVDFRELVKDLAGCFYTRIEMRQIGVRDEAKHVGGLGPCGRELCCSSFLQEFVPVTVKMAKEQNIALNPLKISGVCGRLMCCLGYEIGSGSCSKKGGGKGKPRDKAAATSGSEGRDKGRGRGNRRGEQPARADARGAGASTAGASTDSTEATVSTAASKDGVPGCGGCPSETAQQPPAQRPERAQDRNQGRNQGGRNQGRIQEGRNRAEGQSEQGRGQQGSTQNERRPSKQNQGQNKGQNQRQGQKDQRQDRPEASPEGETKAAAEAQPRSRRSRGRSRGRGRSRRQRNAGQGQTQGKEQGQLEDKRQGQGQITDGSEHVVDKVIVAKEPALLVSKPAAPLSIRRDDEGGSKTDG